MIKGKRNGKRIHQIYVPNNLPRDLPKFQPRCPPRSSLPRCLPRFNRRRVLSAPEKSTRRSPMLYSELQYREGHRYYGDILQSMQKRSTVALESTSLNTWWV
jgi:hypothetical protein